MPTIWLTSACYSDTTISLPPTSIGYPFPFEICNLCNDLFQKFLATQNWYWSRGFSKINKIVSVSQYHSAGSRRSCPRIRRQFLLFWVSASTHSICTAAQAIDLKPASLGRVASKDRVLAIQSGQNAQFFACRQPMSSYEFSQQLPCFCNTPTAFHRG